MDKTEESKLMKRCRTNTTDISWRKRLQGIEARIMPFLKLYKRKLGTFSIILPNIYAQILNTSPDRMLQRHHLRTISSQDKNTTTSRQNLSKQRNILLSQAYRYYSPRDEGLMMFNQTDI